MNRKQSQSWTTMLSDWLELFYLQAVLPEKNDIIPLLTIKNSATPLFAFNGNTVYKPPLASWRAKRFGMKRHCNSIRWRFAPFPH
jgi:hypothetical protein